MSETLTSLALILAALIFGAVPFAQVYARRAGISDLRHVGSKNPGVANLYRLAGRRYAARAAALDGLKGALPVMLAQWAHFSPWIAVLAGSAAVVGHIYSPLLGFRGGKGMGPATGMLFVFLPIPTLVCLVVAVLVYRYWLHWVPGSIIVLLLLHFMYALITQQPMYIFAAQAIVALLGLSAWIPQIIQDPLKGVPPALRDDGSEY